MKNIIGIVVGLIMIALGGYLVYKSLFLINKIIYAYYTSDQIDKLNRDLNNLKKLFSNKLIEVEEDDGDKYIYIPVKNKNDAQNIVNKICSYTNQNIYCEKGFPFILQKGKERIKPNIVYVENKISYKDMCKGKERNLKILVYKYRLSEKSKKYAKFWKSIFNLILQDTIYEAMLERKGENLHLYLQPFCSKEESKQFFENMLIPRLKWLYVYYKLMEPTRKDEIKAIENMLGYIGKREVIPIGIEKNGEIFKFSIDTKNIKKGEVDLVYGIYKIGSKVYDKNLSFLEEFVRYDDGYRKKVKICIKKLPFVDRQILLVCGFLSKEEAKEFHKKFFKYMEDKYPENLKYVKDALRFIIDNYGDYINEFKVEKLQI